MKILKPLLVLFSIVLMIMPVVTSEQISKLVKNEEKTNDELPMSTNVFYVGAMYIQGTGDYDTSVVTAVAQQNLRLKVKLGGSDVVIKARYEMDCPGLFDCGYAKLWANGAEGMEVETEYAIEGYMYTTIHNCHIGQKIEWFLYVMYDDLLFPRPLVDFDGGGGICSFSLTKIRVFNLPLPRMILKGTILCV